MLQLLYLLVITLEAVTDGSLQKQVVQVGFKVGFSIKLDTSLAGAQECGSNVDLNISKTIDV